MCRCFQAVIDSGSWLLPHLFDCDWRGRFLGTRCPKLVHNCSINKRFLEPFFPRVNAPAASIYDNNEMLCSTLGQPHSEVEEATVTYTQTMQRCFQDATEGSQTASALVGVVVSAEVIQRNRAICDPAVKAFSASSIHAITIV